MNVFLKNGNYRKFSIASVLSASGDILFYLAFMTYASKLHNYSLALSLIAISEAIPRLFDTFGGYFADKTQKKFKNIFLMAIFRFILYGIVGLLFISNMSQWSLIIAVVVINFISDTLGAYSSGLSAPLIVDVVGEKEFGEAEGFTSGLRQAVNMVAQFIGAGLLLFMSYANLAFLNAVTFLIAGLLYLSVGLKHKKENSVFKQASVNDKGFFETMKTSYVQVKHEKGLLAIVLTIALTNGILASLGALIPIVMAANRSTMVISTYSFTIAIVGAAVSCGAILGSMFGVQLFKNISVFAMTCIAIVLSLFTTIGAIYANIFMILPAYFLLAVSTSIASIKMSQWLVTTIDRKILASTLGLLNTMVMLAAPVVTVIMTTISGLSNVNYALVVLIVIEIIILIFAIKVNIRTSNTEIQQTSANSDMIDKAKSDSSTTSANSSQARQNIPDTSNTNFMQNDADKSVSSQRVEKIV